jgi:hypothetical protein
MFTDVSEVLAASIIRVTAGFAETYCLHLQGFSRVDLLTEALKMEAVCSTETLVPTY